MLKESYRVLAKDLSDEYVFYLSGQGKFFETTQEAMSWIEEKGKKNRVYKIDKVFTVS